MFYLQRTLRLDVQIRFQLREEHARESEIYFVQLKLKCTIYILLLRLNCTYIHKVPSPECENVNVSHVTHELIFLIKRN